tara:strand:+ start:18651 stop:18875 length:225 start_codon:yes stop_codon:yes gene_type:complete
MQQFTVRLYGDGWCTSVLIDWEVDDDDILEFDYQDDTWNGMVQSAYDKLADDAIKVQTHLGEPECDQILEGWCP